MEERAAHIFDFLHAKRDGMKAFLTDLVEAESPSRDPGAQREVFRLLSRGFTRLGFEAFHFPGKETGGFLLARPGTRARHRPIQLLIGHADTVWERGSLQDMPIRQTGEKMTGPGVFDMKAGLTQMVFAIEALCELGLPWEVTPVCLINSDEEIGSRESSRAIRRLARIANRAYILEPPLGLEGKLKTARKGLGRFTITIRGIAAHAGLDPGKGASAILELSHQVQRLFALNDLPRGITVNVGMIEGGVSPNVVAPSCKAVADVRVPTREDAEAVEEAIYGLEPVHPDVTLKIEGGFGRPPMEPTPRNRALWEEARIAGQALGLQLEEASAGGGSDANTTSLYTATLDGLGTPGDGAHAAREFIFYEKLQERTALLALLLLLPPVQKV